jgi:hypothetical protein
MGDIGPATKEGLLGRAAAVVGQAPPEGDCVVSKESEGVASEPEAGEVHGVIAVVVV